MAQVEFIKATTDEDIQQIADTAEIIWNEHFVPIIGQEQVNYMVDKFQSFHALKDQIENQGYEYYKDMLDGKIVGYIGIHDEGDRLFLSKLYLLKEARGKHIATQGIEFLKEICKERNLPAIYLTCNKYNSNTLAVYDHLGFKTIAEDETDIGSGFIMDDYIMQLDL